MNIAGANIVITGGASGLGLAFGTHLQCLGAQVWALDRDRTALEVATRSYENAADSLHFTYCDVGEPDQVLHTVQTIELVGHGIDVLVNNAAVLKDQALVSKIRGRIKQHSIEDWQETLRSNLTGTFLMGRAVAESLIRRSSPGLIVNVSSISRHGNAGQSAYAASKAGMDALTVTWAQELALYGIRVVGLAPGFVETPMTRGIPMIFLERIRDKSPLKRFGTLEEFKHTIRYVIENDYLHGRVLELDGGLRF